MTQEARRQAAIVAAFLFIALIAISPLLVRPREHELHGIQAGQFPINVKPFSNGEDGKHPVYAPLH